jgi:hypothetical protein
MGYPKEKPTHIKWIPQERARIYTERSDGMIFSEDSRVKIPCILHLVRHGYQYLSLKNAEWDQDTNIFPEVFRSAIARLNPDIESDDIKRLREEVKLLLDYEDLGRAFYERLTARSGIKLIDFADFSNNGFHIVTELPCKNGDEEFRPDISLLVNGMPLVFIEVKKPNNHEGILAERNRIIMRCRNPRFRRFINITPLMIFSNNMEYDDESSKSSYPSISPDDILNPDIALPNSNQLLEKASCILNPIFEKFAVVREENHHLTQLRDWLLPMLMNGQVTVA